MSFFLNRKRTVSENFFEHVRNKHFKMLKISMVENRTFCLKEKKKPTKLLHTVLLSGQGIDCQRLKGFINFVWSIVMAEFHRLVFVLRTP